MNDQRKTSRRKDYESAYSFSSNLINTIHNAIKNKKLLTVEYHSREKGLTRREIEPMDIITREGRTNLVGWCRLRKDWRTFRIDRINLVAIQISNAFEPRPDYDPTVFKDEGSAPYQSETMLEAKSPTQNARANKELNMNSSFGRTMNEDKLKLDDKQVINYSDDEEDLAL